MAFDIGQLLAGGAGGAGGMGGLAGGAGAGEGLLGGQPGLLDLIPAFQFQNDKFNISFDPQKMKRNRAIRRLIEQQTGQRVPETTTPTVVGGGGGGGTNLVTPDSIPGFRGFNPFGMGGLQ